MQIRTPLIAAMTALVAAIRNAKSLEPVVIRVGMERLTLDLPNGAFAFRKEDHGAITNVVGDAISCTPPRATALPTTATNRPFLGLVVVGLGASLAPLDIAVNVALPAITSHFKLALGDVQWLVICYVLVYGSLMLVCGKLGDLQKWRAAGVRQFSVSSAGSKIARIR